MIDSLYEKDRIKVTYLHSPEPGRENEIISGEDHELWLKEKDGEWSRYIIPRGVLKELAKIVDDNDTFGLVSKLDIINSNIYHDIIREEIFFGNVAEAFLMAYQKEEKDFQKYFFNLKKKGI